MSDKSLSSEHLRILMAIAAHDRFGKNGIGCYATHRTLATIAGCHVKSLSRSIGQLAEKGYISEGTNPINKKLRVYKVVYTDDDALAMKSGRDGTGSSTATYDNDIGNEFATDQRGIGNDLVPKSVPIGNKIEANMHANQLDTSSNIFSETDNISSQAEIHSTEVASSLQEDAQMTTGRFLAMLERAIRKHQINNQQLNIAITVLENIMNTEEFGTDNYGRAYRLHEQIGFMLEDINTAD